MKIESYNEKETYNVGYSVGQKAKSGEVYCLSGDLGVGKTVFTQGFAAGLGVVDIVNSPTFTIVHEYNGRMPFYHFDVYRISDVEEMYDIGFEEYLEGEGVCLIEWAELIKDILPNNCVTVKIIKDLSKNFDYREITIS